MRIARIILFMCMCSPVLAFETPPEMPTYTQPTFERPPDTKSGMTRHGEERDRPDQAINEINEADFIVNRLQQIQRICDALDEEYTVDCLATSYMRLTNDLRTIGGDSSVRQSLERASAKLRALVQSNLDKTKPALRAHLTNAESGARMLSTLPVRAVQPDRLSKVRQGAMTVLDEAETVLLRSARRRTEQSVLYQRVAAALRSNKVLLRSA